MRLASICVEFFACVGVIAKNDPAWNQVWSAMNEVARAAFPHLFSPDGNCVLPTVAWKVVDGDGYDTTGKQNSSKEGFAGHFVLRLTSGFAPKVFLKNRYDPSQQVMDARELPTGYYIRALIDITSNDDATKPGIYLNLKLVEVDKPGGGGCARARVVGFANYGGAKLFSRFSFVLLRFSNGHVAGAVRC